MEPCIMYAFPKFAAFAAALMTVFVLSAQDLSLADPAVRARITFRNVNAEELADGLRIRVKPNAKSNYGMFYQRVKIPDAPCYLQVTVGDIENAAAKPWVSNLSGSGGKNLPTGIGSLFSGVNTFSLDVFRGLSFTLGISQLGAGSSEGAWIDYHSIRITAEPAGGVTAHLKNGAKTLAVDGEMSVIFRPEKRLPLPELSGTLFLLPSMTLYREFKLKQDPSGNYRADLRITKEDIALPASAGARMLVQVTLPETKAYYTIPFPIDIRTDRVIPEQVFQAATPEIRRQRTAWFEAIRGTNLALGKTVLFHPEPDMSLTKAGGSDAVDLTDGKLSERSDDKLVFDPKAVGWWTAPGAERFLRIDLGKEEDIDRVVFRCMGGAGVGPYRFPKQFDLYVSRDGRNYYQTSSLAKLEEGEKNLSDFKKFYYLPESGSKFNTYVYPFRFAVRARARHIVLKVTGATGSLYSDELAVIRADDPSGDFNRTYASPPIELSFRGLCLGTSQKMLAILANVPLPERLAVRDMHGECRNAELVVELPEGISLAGGKALPIGNGYFRYTLKMPIFEKQIHAPVFHLAAEKPGDYPPARIYAVSDGEKQPEIRVPIRVFALPELKPFTRLHVSLAWMTEKNAKSIPDFLTNWKKLGFNAIGVFPRYWDAANTPDMLDFMAAARKNGYKIIYNENPIHRMLMQNRGRAPEIYCFSKNNPKIPRSACPGYTGKYYQEEIRRVEKMTELTRPDYVFHDIEIWHNAMKSAPLCDRCREAMGSRKIETYLFACGKRVMTDLHRAVVRAAKTQGFPVPLIGSYDRKPAQAVYAIERFRDIYPETIDFAMPSLYVAGMANLVHDSIRENHMLLKNKNLIPWLTAGTYGKFPAEKMELMLLEALLNGACGITYFQYSDFDSPLYFYHQARALSFIRPYETLIAEGVVAPVEIDNAKLICSALKRGREMILLIANYSAAPPETTVRLPVPAAKVRNLKTGRSSRAEHSFTAVAEKDSYALYHIAW